jgi:N-methylhydantoinase B/oxoprolinase/acetone carboxylase alpha subunit
MSGTFDAIRLQVMWARLLAVVEEQAQTLIRTAFSTVVTEAGDLSAGVFDLDGRMIAQAATGTPGHVNTMAETVRDFLEQFPPEAMQAGDHFITNDPWRGAGHLHDVTVVTPAFRGGRLVALFACICHQIDMGGRGLGPDAESVYEEGLFIPLMRLAQAGKLNESLFQILRANVRQPYEVEGDVMSYMTANEVGARRLDAMLDEFGDVGFATLADFVVERSRQAMLREVRKLPKGKFTNSMRVDGYDQPVTLVATVEVDGDRVLIDYAGSSPASRFGINLVLNYTRAYSAFAIRAAVAPEVPNNAGSLGVIETTGPLGSIVNVERPAPVSARHVIGQMLPDVVFGCLAQMMPGKIPAEGASCIWSLQLRGGPEAQRSAGIAADAPPATAFSLLSFNSGGSGARARKDGLSATAFPSGVRGTSVEALENLAPVVVWCKELMLDSGGAGRQRGGLGQIVDVGTIDGAPFFVFAMFDRVLFPARGSDGGQPGMVGAALLDNGETLRIKGKQLVPAGRRLQLCLPGGGGVGDPLERDLERVDADVRAGLVSREEALRLYGVVIDAAWAVDEAASLGERARRVRERANTVVSFARSERTPDRAAERAPEQTAERAALPREPAR